MVKWEKIEDNKVKMEIELPEDKVEEALDKAYKKVVKDVNVPGFRKGKAPRKILETKYGPEIFYEDAVQIMVPDAYSQALAEETEIEPIDEPDIDIVQIEKGKPLIFTATVEVMPEVELGEYKGIEVEVEREEVTEEQVNNYLEGLREQHARLVAVEDEEGEAAEGDMLLLDFKGYVDGEPFEGGEAGDYSLEIGSGNLIEGFEEQLIGARPGEDREVKVTFPQDYHENALAGKEAVFEVKVKELKKKEYPELDDDFAREVSEFDTFEEYKEDLFEKFKEEAENRNRQKLESAVIEEAARRSSMKVPEPLVERQIDHMMSELEQRFAMQGLKMEQFLEISGRTREELRSQYREEAVDRVRANLTLDTIIKKEGFGVEDHEVEEKLQELADSYNEDVEHIREVIEKQGRLDMMREEVRMRKVIDFLVNHAEVKYVEPGEADQEEQTPEEEDGEKDVDVDNEEGQGEETEEVAGETRESKE